MPVLPPIHSGQLCTRTVEGGTVLVGLVALPTGFVPEEGRPYLMVREGTSLSVVPEMLDQVPQPAYHELPDLSALVRAAVWPGTTHAEARVVRFLAAFPEANQWTVFGPSTHPATADQPTHLWQAIEAGHLRTIPAPIEARGLALSQILNQEPIWPGPDGDRYTLSQHPSFVRPIYHRYAQLLAQSTRDPDLDARLESVIRADPELSYVSIGRVDRDYCAFLAALDEQGHLTLDEPRRASEVAVRAEVAHRVIRAQLAQANAETSPKGSTPRSRRTP